MCGLWLHVLCGGSILFVSPGEPAANNTDTENTMTAAETRIMEHVTGPDSNPTVFMAVHRAFYTVERRSYGIWSVSSSHRDVEVAKAEARRLVDLFKRDRKDVRIKRRWRAVAAA